MNSDSVGETLLDNHKLRIANHAADMARNLRMMKMVDDSDRRERDQYHRVNEAIARKKYGENLPAPDPCEQPGDDPVNIFIDSPIDMSAEPRPESRPSSESRPPPEPPRSLPNWKRTAAIAALAAGAGGGAIGTITSLLTEPPPAIEQPTDGPDGYRYTIEKWVPSAEDLE